MKRNCLPEDLWDIWELLRRYLGEYHGISLRFFASVWACAEHIFRSILFAEACELVKCSQGVVVQGGTWE